MQRSLWPGLILIALVTSAFADPQAKVRKVSDQENSYTYYNWKPAKPKAVAPVAAPAPAATVAPAYTPVRPTPALLNPAAAGGYVDPNPAPPVYYGPAPQSYYGPGAGVGVGSGFYSTGYSYPGLSVSQSGFNAGLSINGVYRNGNVTIQAGSPGFYGPGPGFYGPGYQGGGGFQGHRGFQGGGGMPNSGFRGGFVPRR